MAPINIALINGNLQTFKLICSGNADILFHYGRAWVKSNVSKRKQDQLFAGRCASPYNNSLKPWKHIKAHGKLWMLREA